jgi:hypothetical protein
MGTSGALVRPGSPRSATPIPRLSPRPGLAKQGFRAGGDGVSAWPALGPLHRGRAGQIRLILNNQPSASRA